MKTPDSLRDFGVFVLRQFLFCGKKKQGALSGRNGDATVEQRSERH
jgi:hypothetical protein